MKATIKLILNYGKDTIVTSSGQNDTGLYEANLRDERFLPFEGAGAISTWRLKLPKQWRQFDYSTITDVIMHLRYTARSDGLLADKAQEALAGRFTTLAQNSSQTELLQAISFRHHFSNEWHSKMDREGLSDTNRSLVFPLNQELFPYLYQGNKIEIQRFEVLVDTGTDSSVVSSLDVSLEAPVGSAPKALVENHWCFP